MNRVKGFALLLLCVGLLIGCGTPGPTESDQTPTRTPQTRGTAAATSVPTTTSAAPVTSTAATTSEPQVGRGTTGGDPGQLVSRPVDTPPIIDGQIDALWQSAEPLRVPTTWGAESTEHALDVELRALHDEQTLYLLAQWSGELYSGGAPAGQEDTVYNQLTVHWRIPEPDAEHLNCSVACHTIFAEGQGRVAYANAETIPHGGSETLPVAGGRQTGGPGAGVWVVEWSRPLVNGNPFDLQLGDPERAYVFMVKVFARIEGRPDPISKPHRLVFGR